MPVYLYILQSQSSGRYYVGVTEHLDRRLEEHNSGQTASTRQRGPWELVYTEVFATRAEAVRRERQIKGWKSHAAVSAVVAQR